MEAMSRLAEPAVVVLWPQLKATLYRPKARRPASATAGKSRASGRRTRENTAHGASAAEAASIRKSDSGPGA